MLLPILHFGGPKGWDRADRSHSVPSTVNLRLSSRRKLFAVVPSHRGAHPEDDEQFAPAQVPALRAAVCDLPWLRARGYGDPSSLKMVGNRYRLTRRQRNAVARAACTTGQRAHRVVRRRAPTSLAGCWIEIDAFNVLISVKGMLGGSYLFLGRDRAYRDVDPIRGTYRVVEETAPAIKGIRATMKCIGVKSLTWWLDAYVSNVGRLKTRLADARPSSLGWEIRVRESVDEKLVQFESAVATSDSALLDQIEAWCSVEEMVRSHWDGHGERARPTALN